MKREFNEELVKCFKNILYLMKFGELVEDWENCNECFRLCIWGFCNFLLFRMLLKKDNMVVLFDK